MIHGYDSPVELIGCQILDLIAPSGREKVAQLFSEAVSSGIAPSSIEISMLRKNGEVVETEVKPTVISQENGTVTTQGLLIDISQRKRAEEERLQLDQRLQRAQKAESLGRMAAAMRIILATCLAP